MQNPSLLQSAVLLALLAADDSSQTTVGRNESDALERARPGIENCRIVEGGIDARMKGIALTLKGLRLRGAGEGTGDLPGDLRLSIARVARTPEATRLVVILVFTTLEGRLELRGDALATVDPDSTNHRMVTGTLRVRKGTDAFDGVEGEIETTGTAHTGRRDANLRYRGKLCAPTADTLTVR